MRLIAFILMALLTASAAPAYDLIVQPGGAVTSIVAAAAIASTGTVTRIVVYPGVYNTGEYRTNPRLITIKSLTGELAGSGSAEDTIVDCAGGSAPHMDGRVVGLTIRNTGGLGTGARGAVTLVNCVLDGFRGAPYGTVAQKGLTAMSNCVVTRCYGVTLVEASATYNCYFVGNEAYGSYSSVVYAEDQTVTCIGNVFANNKLAGRGEIYRYNNTLNAQNNLIITSNKAFEGTINDLGGNVSSSVANAAAVIYAPPTGTGTNLTARGLPLPLYGGAAWSAGVHTSAAAQARFDGLYGHWRGQTNNASGAFYQPTLFVPQFRGVLIL